MMVRALPLLLAAVALGAGCAGSAGTPITAQATMADSAEMVYWGVRHTLHDAGVMQAQLTADTAFVFDNNNRYELRAKIRMVIHDSIGVASATLTAREATYSITSRSMEARGDVVVTSTDGKRLDTQHLVYDQATNRVRSDSAFVIVEPTRRTEGTSFVSDPKMEFIICPGCVITETGPGGGGAPPAEPPAAVIPPVIPPVDTLLRNPGPIR
jgi:LPS export ABC transporter protein LptC